MYYGVKHKKKPPQSLIILSLHHEKPSLMIRTVYSTVITTTITTVAFHYHTDNENSSGFTGNILQHLSPRRLLSVYWLELPELLKPLKSQCSFKDPLDPQKELLDPAVKGTLNVLEAANRFGVRRSKQVEFKELGSGVETGVYGVHDEKRVWFEVELQGAQRDHEAEVFQVSNDDTAVAQRRLKDKQPEEKTNTDCLVKEQKKEYQTGWKIKTGIQQQNGLIDEANVTLFAKLARDREQHLACKLFGYREDSNRVAFIVVAVEKIYAHESLNFNNTVTYEVISKWKAGLKEDMDVQSDVYVLSNDDMVLSCKAEIWATKGLLVKTKINVLGLEIIRDQSGNTLRVSQFRIHNEKLVQTLLKEHSTLSLEDSLSRDCDVKRNGIATRALVKGCSRSEVPVQVKVVAYRYLTNSDTKDVFETTLPPAPTAGADAQALADWDVLFDHHNEVACLMLGTMSPKLYQQFEHNSPLEMKISEVHSLLIEFEKSIKRNKQPIVGASSTPHVMAIQGGRVQKYKPQVKAKGKGKGKGPQNSYPTKPKKPQPYKKERPTKDGQCHHCKEEGHWKRNCPVYLAELMKNKKKNRGQNVASTYSVSMNNMLYFNAITVNGIYEIDMHDSTLPIVNLMYSISNKKTKSNLDSTYLWHCRLAHINKKRIEKLQNDGLLKSTDNEPFNQCVSCISGKMTKKPFSHKSEKVKDVLRLIHTDVCGPLRYVSNKGASYFITFTDDYSRYGYAYLLKHKHEVFETFKVFKSEVENQLGKTIKAIRSDHGGEYISQEFKDYIKSCGIVQQLTPPYTPQHSGVSERRNRTLLNMVRSMMSLATLPLSFWDYALESAARILNMVPTKKVDTTPYELWHGKVHNLSYLKRHPIEEESLAPIVSQEEDVIPVRRSVRTHKAPDRLCLNVEIDPDRLCFNVEVEEHSLGDLNEPAKYKAALLDPEFEKLLVAMNVEMQSMYGNKFWRLVVLPPNAKVVKSKWIYKKKTNMDGKVHIYKARLVAKGCTQTYGVDYKETFSPVADIRAIRILIAIAAYYDYEIWQMDVKTAKVCKLQRSIYGLKQASRSWNKRFDEEVKKFGFHQNLDEPCVYQKASGSNVIFIILYVDDIILMRNHIPSFQEVKTYLSKYFFMKDLRQATIILGIKIYRDRSRRLIELSQNAYLDKVLKRYRMDNSKRGSILMQVDLYLSKSHCATTSAEMKRMQNVLYASTVGSIMYAVRNTKDTFLVYGGDPEAELRVNCIAMLDSKPIKMTRNLKLEAEYIAASEAAKEAVSIRKFIDELGVVPSNDYPIKINCDNSAAIIMAKESGIQKGDRHFKRKYHYVCECIETGEINIVKVHTYDNLADLFTKALAEYLKNGSPSHTIFNRFAVGLLQCKLLALWIIIK
nr:hypothetical protein [Tanacetum cinerariifolium]